MTRLVCAGWSATLSEPLLGFLVPIEMREQYEGRDQSRIDGIATYGRFRQFQVNTSETFLIKR